MTDVPPLRLAGRDVIHRRRALARRLTRAGFAALATSFVAAVLGAPGAVALAGVAALAAAMALSSRLARGASREGSLEVSRAGVTVAAGAWRVTVDAAQLAQGWVRRDGASARVEFTARSGDVLSVAVDDAAQGHAALAAAGLAPGARRIHVMLGERGDGVWHGAFATLFVLGQGTPVFLLAVTLLKLSTAATAALGAGLLALAWVVGARTLGPARLTLGADGVAWRDGFSRGFAPWRDLRDVEVDGRCDVVLVLRGGRRVRLTHTRRDRDRAEGVADLVRTAMARGPELAAPDLASLDRHDRTLEAWRASLQAASGAGAYRGAGLTRDELARALEAHELSAERRLGAALALVGGGDDAARTRVRVAAEACAHEALREALERVADDRLDEAAAARVAPRRA